MLEMVQIVSKVEVGGKIHFVGVVVSILMIGFIIYVKENRYIFKIM